MLALERLFAPDGWGEKRIDFFFFCFPGNQGGRENQVDDSHTETESD